MSEPAPVTVRDVAQPGEADRYQSVQRRLAWYYIAVLIAIAPLHAFRWLGEKCDSLLDWIDLPAYRMRNELHALNREWHIRARRLRAARSQASPGDKS